MKSRYFAPETVHKTSLAMLDEVRELRQRHADIVFDAKHGALLVLDLQEYFFSESSHAFIPSAATILPGVQLLAATFAAGSRPVILTKHENTKEDARRMSVWWRDLISPEVPSSNIVSGFGAATKKVICKHQYDAFHETELETMLCAANVTQVVITGVMTHLCCETTARSAFMRGFDVFFCIDGTATYNEAFHRATLLNLAHGFAVPVLVAEILAGFR